MRRYQPPAVSFGFASGLAADRVSAFFAGGVLLSLAGLAILMATRLSGLPDQVAIHLNAAGQPNLWASPETLWRIPFSLLMISVMGGLVAFRLHKHDHFAAHFLLGALLVIHLIGWIAALQLLW